MRALGKKPLDIPTLTQSYLLACGAEGKSRQTLRWYGQKLDAFTAFLSVRKLPHEASQLTPDTVRGFVAHLQASGISAFTVRGYVQVIRGLYSWLADEGYLDENPISRVNMPKTPRYVVKPLEDDDVRRLLAAIDPRTPQGSRDLAMLLSLLDTGMRLGELASLSLSDGQEAVERGMMKGKAPAPKPTCPFCGAALGKPIAEVPGDQVEWVEQKGWRWRGRSP
jgi:site-specific recombinase XerD